MKRCGPTQEGYVEIQLAMVDLDVVQRVASLFDVGYSTRIQAKRQPLYMARLRGFRAAALMKKLKPLMGIRRQGQIETALKEFHRVYGNPPIHRKRLRAKHRASIGYAGTRVMPAR
jgi:hypothetical protein